MSPKYSGPFQHRHNSNVTFYLQRSYAWSGRDTHRPVARGLAEDAAGCAICPAVTGLRQRCQLGQVSLGHGEKPQHPGPCPAGAGVRQDFYFLFYVPGGFACMYIWSCARWPWIQKRALGPLALGLQTGFSHHVMWVAGNAAWILS